MADDRLSQLVVAALVALNDIHHQLHHVSLHRCELALHGVDLLHAFLNLLHNGLARVPVDEDDPLVDEELLRFEFDLDGLQHFNRLDDDWEGRLWHRGVVLLEEEEEDFQGAFDLCG